MRNQMTGGFIVARAASYEGATPHDSYGGLETTAPWPMNYLLVNRPEIAQNELIMKRYSLLVGMIITTVTCASSFAQDKASLQSNATVVSLLQGSAGKSVELHLRSGEKMGGKIAQVTDNIVHLSNLTGAEYFDAFVDMKDISAVVVRVGGR
jgi:hypothetical protein